MEVYLKIRNNLFYKLSDGKCHVVDIDKKSFKSLKTLPSGYIDDVKLIPKEDYENILKEIMI